MDDKPDTEAAAKMPVRAQSRSRWVIIGAAVGALMVAGIIGAVFVLDREDTPDYAATQIGWMREGCQQWTDGYQGTNGPDDEWCNSMAGWMDGRMGDESMMDRGQMMGPMMWQNPTNMLATCEQWMAETPNGMPGGVDQSAWCEQMTDWMDQNMGDWDNWMENGP
jgi:hypothetical protein